MPLRFNEASLKRRRLGPLVFRVLSEPIPALARRATLIRLRQPPRAREEPVVHRKTHEFIYYLKGGATGIVGGKRIRLSEGDVLHIPPGVWHQFLAGPSGVEAVCLFMPPMDLRAPDIIRRKEPRR